MGINCLTITGRLTRDPEVRYTSGGKAVCSFAVAVDSGWGEKKRTSFFDVQVWDKAGESCGQHLKKGSRVAVTGSMEQEFWQDKQSGQKRSSWRVKPGPFGVEFLDGVSKRSGDEDLSPPDSLKEDFNPDDADVPPVDSVPF